MTPVIIFENLMSAEASLLHALREFLQVSPSEIRLVFRNCVLAPGAIRDLCEVTGTCGVGFVHFQQTDFLLVRRTEQATAQVVLSSEALQNSTNLRVLELECPLMPEDLNSAVTFLERSKSLARLVLLLRPELLRRDVEAARRSLAKVEELCASELGARVTIVQYQRASRLVGGSARLAIKSATNVNDASLSSFQQEVRVRIWYEKAFGILDRVLLAYATVDLPLAVASFFDVKPFGYQLPYSNGFTPTALRSLWRPLRATAAKERGIGLA